MPTSFPTPHLEKLKALLINPKLPPDDRPLVEAAIQRYRAWITALDDVAGGPEEALAESVRLLDEYKRYIDLEFVFDSAHDFLYRQKGQLKVDNTIIEEFLPRLVRPPIIPDLDTANISVGPMKCFSSVYFASRLDHPGIGGGLNIRTKDQDFAIARTLFVKTSYDPSFVEAETIATNLAYVAAECKTNLDKTMFQEASATAHDIKGVVPRAKYFLLCEWLDMTPTSTAPTDIDEVLILRKAKRIGSQARRAFSTAAGRTSARASLEGFLVANPFAVDVFARFVTHLRGLFHNEEPVEEDVLDKGFF